MLYVRHFEFLWNPVLNAIAFIYLVAPKGAVCLCICLLTFTFLWAREDENRLSVNVSPISHLRCCYRRQRRIGDLLDGDELVVCKKCASKTYRGWIDRGIFEQLVWLIKRIWVIQNEVVLLYTGPGSKIELRRKRANNKYDIVCLFVCLFA